MRKKGNKLLGVGLSLCLGFTVLGGCRGAETDPSEAKAEDFAIEEVVETESEPGDSEAAEPEGNPEIHVETIREECLDEASEKVRLTGEFDEVKITGEGYGTVAQTVELWNLDNKANYVATMNLYREWLSEEEIDLDAFPNFAVDFSLESTRADSCVISLVLSIYEFGGGAHGNYGSRGATFDVKSGDRIAFRELFADPEGFLAWSEQECWDQLLAQYGDGLYEDAKTIVRETWADEPNWYFTASGITVSFDPYELGPYAMGAPTVNFSYEDCGDYLKPEYTK